jgi:hypothetical protein
VRINLDGSTGLREESPSTWSYHTPPATPIRRRCLVDDAQWLDETSAQVMTFVARRLAAERVALLFAVREPEGGHTLPFAGLPELHVGGLGRRDARALFSTAIPAPIDDRVGERIVAEARGNPLALPELPRSASLAQLAGGFERPDSIAVPHRLEQSFVRRLSDLPTETQLLLLAASGEPTGDVDLLWRAAEQMVISRGAMPPAEAAGLLELDHWVRFRHPLVRSAVYRAASPPDRRRVHRALAAATDPQADPDRLAWHRARATQGADEEVASDLMRSAQRARSRWLRCRRRLPALGSSQVTVADYAMAVLHNGFGNYADARVAAARVCRATSWDSKASAFPSSSRRPCATGTKTLRRPPSNRSSPVRSRAGRRGPSGSLPAAAP